MRLPLYKCVPESIKDLRFYILVLCYKLSVRLLLATIVQSV